MSQNQQNLEYLRSIVGDYDFSMICIALAGKRLTFPQREDHINIESRNRNIRLDYWSGMNHEELIEKYKLSKSQIYKIIEDRH